MISKIISYLLSFLSTQEKPAYDYKVEPIEPMTKPKEIHSIDWCGGKLEDRKAMYALALKVCADEKMSLTLTKDLLATVWGESGWNQWCENHGNKNGSADFGLCQFNDGKLHGQSLWIGKGATFKDKDEVLNNPEKCIRTMCHEFKAGHAFYWMAWPGRSKFFDKML